MVAYFIRTFKAWQVAVPDAGEACEEEDDECERNGESRIIDQNADKAS